MPDTFWRVGACICKLRNFCNLCNQTAISAIRLQYQQSDCNLSNQTAMSAIRLQSPQSMMRFYHVVHIGVHFPECVKHPAHCLRLQSPQSDCNIHNQTAISRNDSRNAWMMMKWVESQRVLNLILNRRNWNRGFPLVESPKSRPFIGWEDWI